MNWQKWVLRGLIFAVVAGLGGLAVLYYLWTSPEAVRQLVQEKLGVRFVQVGVQVGSARLRLLGGIGVTELRLCRADDLDHRSFLYVPDATIYHDKEHMLDGKVAIRRVELNSPQLRILRTRDGRFNLQGILGPVDLTERVPTIVMRRGAIIVEDQGASASPLFEIRNVQITILNDPLPVLQVEGTGEVDVLGPIRFSATIPRPTFAATVKVELSRIPLRKELTQRIASLFPSVGTHLDWLTGTLRVEAKVQLHEEPGRRPTHEVSFHLRNGRCDHPLLPRVLDHVELKGQLLDGVIPEAKLTAHAGPTRLEARIGELTLPDGKVEVAKVEGLIREIDVAVHHLDIDDAVLARLPESLLFVKPEYSPAGPLSFRYRYRRAGPGPLVKEWTLEPQGMSGCFAEFAYPASDIRGVGVFDVSRLPVHNMRFDLTGTAGGQPVSLRGTVKGEKKKTEVMIDIDGKGLLLDNRVMKALPPRVRKVAGQFLPALSRKHGLDAFPMGKADVQAFVRREAGQTRIEKRFTIRFKDCGVMYDQFPLPLDEVCGVLDIFPDHWEARGFRAVHGGGELYVDGRSHQLPGRLVVPAGEDREPTPPEQVQVSLKALGIPLDRDFENALVPTSGNDRRDLQTTWKKLRLEGRLSFAAEVIDHPGQPQKLDVTVNVHGCSMKPTFFDYALEQLTGTVRYAEGKLYLRDMKARHGAAALGMAAGLIEPGAEGGFKAWLHGLTGQAVPVDGDLMVAVPDSLRRVFEPLKVKTPINLATNLTLVSPGAGRPMEVWWKGALGLEKGAFRTGIEVTDATGRFYCEGYHDGRRLRGVTGQLDLDRASVIGQPLTGLRARLELDPGAADAVTIKGLQGKLFGGTVSGQARLVTAPQLHYDVDLHAQGVQLELLGKHNLGDAARMAQLQGPAGASLHLTGDGSDLLNLKGNGRVDVNQGKMGQLPVLLDLVKAFGLRFPDRTAFEQAHMTFAVEGPQIQVQHLDLFGNAISLRGQGSLDLDGSNINLDFSATPGRVTQMLPPGLDQIPQAISGQLLRIKAKGKLGQGGQIKFDQQLLPSVVEPIRRTIVTITD